MKKIMLSCTKILFDLVELICLDTYNFIHIKSHCKQETFWFENKKNITDFFATPKYQWIWYVKHTDEHLCMNKHKKTLCFDIRGDSFLLK